MKYDGYNTHAQVFRIAYNHLRQAALDYSLESHLEELDKMEAWVTLVTIPLVDVVYEVVEDDRTDSELMSGEEML